MSGGIPLIENTNTNQKAWGSLIENEISLNCQFSNTCFLENIVPVFNTKCPFHVFWSYWSRIKYPNSFFPKILIPHSRLSKTSLTDLQDASALPFPTMPNISISDISMCRFWSTVFLYFLYCLKCLGVSKVYNNWFWEKWSRPLDPQIMKNKGLGVLPQVESKSY